jgi:glycosyltransferase involved in cell wall biosynthesis
MKRVIHVLANDGSPLGVTEQSICGQDNRNGVGGAELAILTLCRGWHEMGHDVTFYNDPTIVGGSVFKQEKVNKFDPQAGRDILIIFRSPNPASYNAKGKKIWLSCDQYTVGDFSAFAEMVDYVVGISEFHSDYFKMKYGIHNMKVIDIPIRDWEYPENPTKVKNSCIFTSVPDRGLPTLMPIWDRIIEQVPDATLTITSDWSLWTGNNEEVAVSPYRIMWAGKKGVKYAGAVKRDELIKIQSGAEFHLYPGVYDELFCISVAESQVAGAVPITSRTGALRTTNRLGYIIEGSPTSPSFISQFVSTTVKLMQSDTFADIGYDARKKFGMSEVLNRWEMLFDE